VKVIGVMSERDATRAIASERRTMTHDPMTLSVPRPLQHHLCQQSQMLDDRRSREQWQQWWW